MARTGASDSNALLARQISNRWMVLIAILIGAAIASVGLLLVSLATNAADLRAAVETSFERRLRLERVLSMHQDLETASRGYVLTGREDFLSPLYAAEPQIDPELAALDRLSTDGSGHSRLTRLRALSKKKREFVNATVQVFGERGQADAIARIRNGEGKRRMDAIRTEIGQLQYREETFLASVSAKSTTAQLRLEITAIALLILLTGLLCFAGMNVRRTSQSRARALDAVADLSRRRKAVLDAAMDGIFILNPSGSIESVNRTGASMFGYSEEELLRRDIGMLFANPPPIGQVAAFLRQMQLREGDPGTLQEIPGRCKDGSPMAADVAISAVALSDGVHYVSVVRDMSERKKIDRMKSEFVASVSHELRTPLTSIAGSLGLLSNGAGGTLSDRAARLVSIASSNADRLVRLINDILDIEKIDAGKMNFDNHILSLSEIVTQAVEVNRPYAERLGVDITIHGGDAKAFVWADSDRLMQVLTNLISNAAKFSPEGKSVTVSIQPGVIEHRISVSDEGPGIAPEFADRIFKRFAQADSSDARQKGGTGLGLAIVREIVQRLGGKVSYENVPGAGARFNLDLPVTHNVVAETLDRVLLCTQDPAVAGALSRALVETGLHCDIATSTNEAKVAAARMTHRVILVESNLPSGGGIALVREMREDLGLADTPILMISAESEHGDVAGEVLRIAEWLPKPASLETVVAAVNRAIEHLRFDRLPRVLHIEDDPDIVRLVEAAFEDKAELTSAPSIARARMAIAQANFDLAILDLGLADGSGLELLGDLAEAPGGPIPVIIFSAQDADPEIAARVQAYLTKSHTPIERLVRTVIRLARPSAFSGDPA